MKVKFNEKKITAAATDASTPGAHSGSGPVQRNTQSRNKNKNSDNKALRLFLLKNAIGDIFTRYRNENDAVYNLF